jgi:hypothetical protein
MVRVFALVAVLAALPTGAYVFVQRQAGDSGSTPSAPLVVQDEAQANAAVAGTNFRSADVALQAWFAANGSYAGASLPPGTGVVLVRADSTGYCLQAGTGANAEREVGPNGHPEPGAC